jgi:hypothetical protein
LNSEGIELGIVKLYGYLNYITGTIMLVVFLTFGLLYGLGYTVGYKVIDMGWIEFSKALALSVFHALALMVVGKGVLLFKPWGRIAAFLMICYSLIYGLILIYFKITKDMFLTRPALAVFVIISLTFMLLTLWALTRPRVKEQFK